MSYQAFSEQVAAAKARFPNLRQTNQNQLQIVYPSSPGVVFHINVSPTYPQSAPTIKRGSEDFSTSLVTYWRPVFTITHLCENLEVAANIPEPTRLTLNRDEVAVAVRQTDPASLKHRQDRIAAVNRVPCVAEATHATARNKDEISRLREKIDEMTVAACEGADKFERLLAEKQRLTAASGGQGVSLMAQARDKQVSEMRAQAAQIDAQVEQLREDHSSMPIDAYLAKIRELRVQQYRLTEVAARMEVLTV